MHLTLSTAERFLAGFHDGDPGVTLADGLPTRPDPAALTEPGGSPQ